MQYKFSVGLQFYCPRLEHVFEAKEQYKAEFMALVAEMEDAYGMDHERASMHHSSITSEHKKGLYTLKLQAIANLNHTGGLEWVKKRLGDGLVEAFEYHDNRMIRAAYWNCEQLDKSEEVSGVE